MWQRKDVGNHRKELGHSKIIKAKKICPTHSLICLDSIYKCRKTNMTLMKPQNGEVSVWNSCLENYEGKGFRLCGNGDRAGVEMKDSGRHKNCLWVLEDLKIY